MKKIIRYILLSVVLGSVLLNTTPAYAETPEDAAITIQSIHAYRNLAEDGDMAIVFHWRWSSANTSATPASSAVSISLSLNGTVKAMTTPYVFPLFENDGYGDGMTGIYFSANSSPTWGGAYNLVITGLPAYFSPPPYFNQTLQASDYTASTTQEANRTELQTYILNEIDIFKTIYPDVTLKSSSDVGVVLSSNGESYFTSAIPGLMSLCPQLFFVQLSIPTVMTTQNYTMALGDTYTARLDGTDLQRGAERVGDYIDVSGNFIWGILTFIGCLAVIVVFSRKGWPIEVPLFTNIMIVAGASLLIGDLLFTLIMIIGLIAIMGIAWSLYGKRA